MENYQAKISEKKKEQLSRIKQALIDSSVVCVIDLASLPSKIQHTTKNKLRDKLEIKVYKKRLLKLAINQIKDKKDLTSLLPYLDKCVPGILFTKENPFAIYKTIKKSKSSAPAKAGQISPKDLIVEAGPTNFPPGPIIGELGQAGIVAAVEQGKVTIKRQSTVAKEGQVITQKQAEVLTKLGIQPMEIGLNIIAAYEQGIIYDKKILDVDEKEYLNNLRAAISQAYNFTINIGYATQDNIKLLIGRASKQAKILSENHEITTSENIKDQLKEAEKSALKFKEKVPEESKEKKSSFDKEAEKAHEIFEAMKEKDIKYKEGHKN